MRGLSGASRGSRPADLITRVRTVRPDPQPTGSFRGEVVVWATVNRNKTWSLFRVLVPHQQPVQIPREMIFIFRARACSSLSAFLRDASNKAANSSAL